MGFSEGTCDDERHGAITAPELAHTFGSSHGFAQAIASQFFGNAIGLQSVLQQRGNESPFEMETNILDTSTLVVKGRCQDRSIIARAFANP